MPRRRRMSRFAPSQPGNEESKTRYLRLTRANIVSLDKVFQDIACVDSVIEESRSRVWLQCKPGAEDLRTNADPSIIMPQFRRWGQYQTSSALMLPLRITPGHTPGISLRRYEVQIILHEEVAGNRNNHAQNTGNLEVFLLDVPQPQRLSREFPILSGQSCAKWWNFCSTSGTEQRSGQSYTVSMTWDAVNHEPEVVLCALAISHPKSPFYITCRVTGEVSGAAGIQTFDNSHIIDRIWRLQLLRTEYDLQTCFDTMPDQVRKLNSSIMEQITPKGPESAATAAGKIYSTIYNSGNLHAGDWQTVESFTGSHPVFNLPH